jgi:hypothetical protein
MNQRRYGILNAAGMRSMFPVREPGYPAQFNYPR